MVFKKFERNKISTRVPGIRITESTISFNASATYQFVKDNRFAELYFDEDEKVIGMKIVDEETESAFPIRYYEQPHTPIVNINCKPFIDYFHILEVLGEPKTLPIEEDKETGMLLAKLKGR